MTVSVHAVVDQPPSFGFRAQCSKWIHVMMSLVRFPSIFRGRGGLSQLSLGKTQEPHPGLVTNERQSYFPDFYANVHRTCRATFTKKKPAFLWRIQSCHQHIASYISATNITVPPPPPPNIIHLDHSGSTQTPNLSGCNGSGLIHHCPWSCDLPERGEKKKKKVNHLFLQSLFPCWEASSLIK